MKKNIDNPQTIISRKQKIYNYTPKDFAYWIITEKDYNFLDEVIKDSHDWIQTYNLKNKNVKANSYYSKSIKNFLPNFKWAENASAFKIDILLYNHTVTSAAKLFFEFKNMNVNLKTK
jgi:type III secretory pathway component EscR